MTLKTQTTGTRAQVWHGTAKRTSGGLTKKDLIKNKAGRIVSKAKYITAKREKRLLKYGYGTQKGKFGFVRKGDSGSSSRSRGRKGRKGRKGKRGGGGLYPLSPAKISGISETSGANVQLLATNY